MQRLCSLNEVIHQSSIQLNLTIWWRSCNSQWVSPSHIITSLNGALLPSSVFKLQQCNQKDFSLTSSYSSSGLPHILRKKNMLVVKLSFSFKLYSLRDTDYYYFFFYHYWSLFIYFFVFLQQPAYICKHICI